MFCPDCGRKKRENENFCPDCGYHYFSEISEPQPPKEKQQCERCGALIEPASICPTCGDKLPSLFQSDPFISLFFKNFFAMFHSPRYFTLSFPYPYTEGITYPILVSGIAAAIFIITLPMIHPAVVLNPKAKTDFLMVSIFGAIGALLIVPLLTYFSSLFIDYFARIFGGKAPVRRTIRIIGAYLTAILITGILFHFFMFGFYWFQLPASQLGNPHVISTIYKTILRSYSLILIAVITILGWLYSWSLGNLYRLSFWNMFLFVLMTYPVLVLIWIIVLIIIPLRNSGIL